MNKMLRVAGRVLLAGLALAGPSCAPSRVDTSTSVGGDPTGANPTTAKLSGQVSQPVGDSVAVSWRAHPYDREDRTVRTALDRSGSFRLTVPLDGPTAVNLGYGEDEMPLFLTPGDDLGLKFKGEQLTETLKVQPLSPQHQKAAAANNYLVAFENQFANNEGYQVLPENIQLYETPFRSFLDYRHKQQKALLQKQAQKGSFTPAFIAYAQAEIDFADANDRLAYPDLREQVVNSEPRLKLSADYYDFLRDPAVVPGPAEAASSPQYQEFLLNYLHYQVPAAGTAASAPGYYPACYQFAKQHLPGPLQTQVLAQVVTETIRLGHVEHATALLADFATLAPPAWTTVLADDFGAHRSRAIGAPAPALPLRSAANKSLRLRAFRNKLVYVMFWDSRLASGRRELPHLKNLIQHLGTLPVVFLNVALDPEPVAWQRNLTALAPAGTNAWVPDGEQAAVRAAWDVPQLPAFFLLDQQGNILNPHPKRLSSRALQDDLQVAWDRAAAYCAVPLPAIAAKAATKPAKPVAKPIPKPTTKPAAKLPAKPGPALAASPIAKPIAKPWAKPVAKPWAKPVAKPWAKPVAKPWVKPVAKPWTKPVAKPWVKPATKPWIKPVAKPWVKPAAKLKTALPAAKPAL